MRLDQQHGGLFPHLFISPDEIEEGVEGLEGEFDISTIMSERPIWIGSDAQCYLKNKVLS
jgi:hypothetical protein